MGKETVTFHNRAFPEIFVKTKKKGGHKNTTDKGNPRPQENEKMEKG